MTLPFTHIPVLLDESIAALQPKPAGRYIDATLGGGGHAEKVLQVAGPTGMLLGIDADPLALKAAMSRLSGYGDRLRVVEAYFDQLTAVARRENFAPIDGILFDLGVSSPQLDRSERGFSFQADAPLDMRFGPQASETASGLLNRLNAEQLQDIFQNFGEERYSRRIAQRIVAERSQAAIRTTRQLAEIVVRATPRVRSDHVHPATRVFQALRIAVNDELGRLGRALPQTTELLRAGGRLVVISFHSLEDRIVKHFMRREASDCVCPPELPVCGCGHVATLRIVTRRPITAGPLEVQANPRARSAKLRVAELITSTSTAGGGETE